MSLGAPASPAERRARQVRPLRTLRLLLLSSHPGPTAAVTILCVVLGLAIALEPWRLLLLGLAVLAGQLSIGFSNDAIDAARDAEVGRLDKPIARGDISRRTVAAAAGVSLVVALILSAVLGIGMLVAHTIVIAGGWIYNAWLKRTAFSVVPFIVSFGTLPSLATLTAPEPSVAAVWASVTGAVLGVSIHFTNALPDLADDRRTGVRGLPHRLGRRAAGAIAFGALALGAVVVLVGPAIGDASDAGRPPGVVEWAGLVVTLVIAVVGLVLAVRRPAHRVLFRLVMAAGLLIAIQLALGGVRLAG